MNNVSIQQLEDIIYKFRKFCLLMNCRVPNFSYDAYKRAVYASACEDTRQRCDWLIQRYCAKDPGLDAPYSTLLKSKVSSVETFQFIDVSKCEGVRFTEYEPWANIIQKETRNAKIVSRHIFKSPLTSLPFDAGKLVEKVKFLDSFSRGLIVFAVLTVSSLEIEELWVD